MRPSTFAEVAGVPAHRSFFWRRLVAASGGAEDVTNWLIAQANARGFLGAIVAREASAHEGVSAEDLVVGLLMPHAEPDARVIKLIVRMLQSGRLDRDKLVFRARRERAEHALSWVLTLVPPTEWNEQLESVRNRLGVLRGTARFAFRYDSQRLIRRPASGESLWRAKRH